MRIPETINGQKYTLDYATNGANEVCHVAILNSDGLDVTDELPFLATAKAWLLACDHHAPANTQSAVQPPVCKDCVHFVEATKADPRFARCAAPQHGVDLVYGKPVMPACEHQRDSDGKGRCGQSGVFFVAKASASTACKASSNLEPGEPA